MWLIKKNFFFLTKSIAGQLIDMLQNRKLWGFIERGKSRSNDENCRSEIFTGALYKKLSEFLRGNFNFTMAFATDGVQVFKSSNYAIWPLFCTINELPFHLKAFFMTLNALWFGMEKPNPNAFCKPFVDETIQLFRIGFKWLDKSSNVVRVSRVLFPIAIADAPARAMLLNFMQFNGSYGCHYCEHPGISVIKGDGHVRVFPIAFPIPPLRDSKTTLLHAVAAINSGEKHIYGVKGFSILSLIPEFDLINGTIPDIMHCVFLGIVKQFLTIWLDSTGKPYSFMAKHFDEALRDIKLPDEILRMYRSYEKYGKSWKASELRNFLLFFSPVILKSLLPNVFYRHWLYLVNCCRLLQKKSMTQEDLQHARILALAFIGQIPDLYGVEHVSYNVHLLNHIVEGVDNWGAPWAYSAFLYEDAGGSMKTQFHGSKCVAGQMFQRFTARQLLREYAAKNINFTTEETISNFFVSRLETKMNIEHRVERSLKAIGKFKYEKLSAGEIIAVENWYDGRILKCHFACAYSRILVNGKCFSSALYSADLKRDNSVVKIGNSFAIIEKIFIVNENCNCVMIPNGVCMMNSWSQPR
jgi:hypothetical protein